MAKIYKICENEDGMHKIQQWVPAKKFLFIFTINGYWKDDAVHIWTGIAKKFKTFTDAQDQIDKFHEEDKKLNNAWNDVIQVK